MPSPDQLNLVDMKKREGINHKFALLNYKFNLIFILLLKQFLNTLINNISNFKPFRNKTRKINMK